MTSKEALERYYSNLLYGNGGFQTHQEELEALNSIKQDLERLEAINKVWHKYEPTESVDINAEHLQELYEYIIYANKENSKLKNAIEILKLKIGVEKVGFEDMYYIYLKDYEDAIEKEQFDLLKEVLGE